MYRVINLLLSPLVLLIFALLWITIQLWRTRELTRRRLLALTFVVLSLYLYGTPAVSYFLLGSLEWKYPPVQKQPENIDAIVILSGGIYAPDDIRPVAVLGESTLYRCLRGAELFDEQNPCPILLSGGKVDANRAGPPLAVAMRDLMHDRFGIDEQYLIQEGESRTTYENAVETARWLKEHDLHRIALVTDASHLHRSVLCFEALEFDVVPVGCAYRATKFHWTLETFLPTASGFRHNDAAIHEYLGIVWYWLKGRL